MAKRQVKLNSVNQTIDIFVGDTSSTTGAGLTGLAFDSTGLKCFYRRGQDGTSTELVLASGLTPTGVYVRGGFCEIDNSGMKGLYRLGIPDESVSGNISSSIIYMYGATNMLPTISELEFTGQDITNSLYNTNVVTWSGTPVGSSIYTDVWRVPGIQTYAVVSGVPTMEQFMFMTWAYLTERSIADVTMTVRKITDSSTAMTFTLNSPTAPTSVTRTS